MDVFNIIREIAIQKSPSIKVSLVKPPTYVSVFYSPEEKPSEIILIYKEACEVFKNESKVSKDAITPGSDDFDCDVTGNPLEDPFEHIDGNISIPCDVYQSCSWSKSEESHLPISLQDARSIFNSFTLNREGKRTIKHPLDIWAVTNPNPSDDGKKKRHDILLGLRMTKAVVEGELSYFARSFVTFESHCNIGDPAMDPANMMKEHLKLSGANQRVQSTVLCVYHLSGELPPHTNRPPSSIHPGNVHLEVKWNQPKVEPPLQEAVSTMVVQVTLGQNVCDVHPLWRQLVTLKNLLKMLEIGENLMPGQKLPRHTASCVSIPSESSESNVSVSEQLKALFSGIFSAQMNGHSEAGFGSVSISSRRETAIPDRTTIHKLKENSKIDKFLRNVDQALLNKRINADAADDLWAILTGCDSLRDLCKAFNTVYAEVQKAQWRPYIRHKNQSYTSALLRALSNTENHANNPGLEGFQNSGIHFALESLIDLGLEKLANDYSYIFIVSDLAIQDELHPPTFPRKGLGIERDTWLSNCYEYLAWLTKMHAALEVSLLTESATPAFEDAFSSITSQALSHFQGAASPIQSAEFLNMKDTFVTFKTPVNFHQISNLLSKPFDLWQLTLSSESQRHSVETLFHRSSFEIFPPQIVSGDSEDYVTNDKSGYCSCKFVTLKNLL